MCFPRPEKNLLPWLVAWSLVAVAYAFLLKVPFSHAYIDFGDGNYQYISRRLNEGIRLYTDILSPQPPFHLWIGAVLERCAEVVGCEPLTLFRWFSVAVRLAASAAVFAIARFLFGTPAIAFLASFLFLFLPEGYRWSQGYQSENLEILFLCGGFLGCLTRIGIGRHLAAILAVCAVWTNMSALPFSLLIIAFAVGAKPFRWKPLLSSAACLILLLGLCLSVYGHAYVENVWTNQVASIPADFHAWLRALHTEGTTIIELEGLFILAALVGMFGFLKGCGLKERERGTAWPERDRVFTVGYGILSLGSAIYVVKGGTVYYIFSLAEPLIAVFSAYALILAFSPSCESSGNGAPEPPNVGFFLPLCRISILVGTIVLLAWTPFNFILGVRSQGAPGVDLPDTYQGRLVEFSDVEVRTIERILGSLSEPGDTIWAPPFLAALSGHPIVMDLSETYLWYVRWQHSLHTEKPDVGVERMISGLTDFIEKESIPLFLLNSRTGQWGQLIIPNLTLRMASPEGGSGIVRIRDLDPRLDRLQSAFEQHYHPILSAPGSSERLYLQGMNERLEIWVPKDRSRYLPPWSRKGFSS